ncbi:hypothetical protein [Dyadobacter luteus]|uniref:hypothetical protein n=1 Tax=Dyadobacter luteus TaxID=2259619 RepID=UPI0011C069BF|nr:hypothetical protein [Dyadobacter luteus]
MTTNEQLLEYMVSMTKKQEEISLKLDKAIRDIADLRALTDKTGDFLGDELERIANQIEEKQL